MDRTPTTLALRYLESYQGHVGEMLPDDVVGQLMEDVDDFIATAEPERIGEFFRACCDGQTDPVLAYVAAGAVEDSVNRGLVGATEALLRAAKDNYAVRRSLGYAWFSRTKENTAVWAALDELESLAIHGQVE